MSVSTRSDRWFDISYTIKRFNENQELLLEDIAKEFGMSRKEMVGRMRELAGGDEKDRVRQALSQDKKRQRMHKRASRKPAEEHQSNVQDVARASQDEVLIDSYTKTPEVDECKKTIAEQRAELETEIEDAKTNLQVTSQSVRFYQSLVDSSDSKIAQISSDIRSQIQSIKELEKSLNIAKSELSKLKVQLAQEQSKKKVNTNRLNDFQAREQEHREYLDMLIDELTKLNNFIVYLIDPMYDMSQGVPEDGRLISNVKIDGVDLERVDSDKNQLSYAQLVSLSQKTGYSNIEELGVAYDFSWLAIQYMLDSDYEAEVITDDPRIHKLINLLLS